MQNILNIYYLVQESHFHEMYSKQLIHLYWGNYTFHIRTFIALLFVIVKEQKSECSPKIITKLWLIIARWSIIQTLKRVR